ncbi:hypothetical protein SJAG_00172 [Schizosaccharomyces japonicus yFS275]|uniref:Uncharacterized protein n=1 Tax=Schizosaccharomyces japonicus (strain yFS275 / FY16936) TaxID=402676 RepID=B6JXN2_SCHJY|nr:hypothetical protein SJAG_00172 [Schizosaccharomyces japonicus yFS275]EEB05176.2 hypothetical protein SJAG_00172 [Schizosaccharomyces japonicus yFS275]
MRSSFQPSNNSTTMSHLITSLQSALDSQYSNLLASTVVSFSKHHDEAIQSHLIDNALKDRVYAKSNAIQLAISEIDNLTDKFLSNIRYFSEEKSRLKEELSQIDSELQRILSTLSSPSDFPVVIENYKNDLQHLGQTFSNKLEKSLELLRSTEENAQKRLIDQF